MNIGCIGNSVIRNGDILPIRATYAPLIGDPDYVDIIDDDALNRSPDCRAYVDGGSKAEYAGYGMAVAFQDYPIAGDSDIADDVVSEGAGLRWRVLSANKRAITSGRVDVYDQINRPGGAGAPRRNKRHCHKGEGD